MKLVKRFFMWIRHFFFPPPGAPTWVKVTPYAVMGFLTLMVVAGGVYGWDYTNSNSFCGTVCHTMPPQYASYLASPHARVTCVECHLGRVFVGNAFVGKMYDYKHGVNMIFGNYNYPIVAEAMIPARDACETCHSPDAFSADLFREIKRYGDDTNNTATSIYLSLKIGGKLPGQGQGTGSHWHVAKRVLYYPADSEDQVIPYIRVYDADGTYTEYTDLTAYVDPKQISESKLKEMDCITCHNRGSHLSQQPGVAVDQAMAQSAIDPGIPDIHRKGVEVLTANFTQRQEALNGIAGLEDYYKIAYPDYYAANADKIKTAITTLQEIFSRSVFYDQKFDWNSHPNNMGHEDFPGCFRCHDGKHLNAKQEAIRLECNLCHSIPVVAGPTDFVAKIEISRGPEPDTHRNPNWITQHRTYLNKTCELCHNTANPGGKDNSSFCSNSACHGLSWKYAGFDAPGLAKIVEAQLPPPPPTPAPAPVAAGGPSYKANIQPLFEASCGGCHGDGKAGGLQLTTYAGVMAGGAGGPVVVAGNAADSSLVQVQSGQHFAVLAPDALELVKQWITGGALEK
jgi:cytochrome c5